MSLKRHRKGICSRSNRFQFHVVTSPLSLSCVPINTIVLEQMTTFFGSWNFLIGWAAPLNYRTAEIASKSNYLADFFPNQLLFRFFSFLFKLVIQFLLIQFIVQWSDIRQSDWKGSLASFSRSFDNCIFRLFFGTPAL